LSHGAAQRVGQVLEFIAGSGALEWREVSPGGAFGEPPHAIDAGRKQKGENGKNGGNQKQNGERRQQKRMTHDRSRIGRNTRRNEPIRAGKNQKHQRHDSQAKTPG
jgi:hypothetical protein